MTKAGFIIAPILACFTFFLWVILQIVQRGSDKRPASRQVPTKTSSIKLKKTK